MRLFFLIAVALLPHFYAKAADSADACATLLNPQHTVQFAEIPDAPTTILTARIVPAERDLPEICRVVGQVSPTIGFLLRLPTKTWNGKFMMGGCGGSCGNYFSDRIDPALVRNYAVVTTDMGHKGVGWSWAFNNLQGQIDFGYRATHVTAAAAKVILAEFYGKPTSHNYYMGCSTGGRQGMVEAQRFPQDFEGLIAGSPVWNQTANNPFFGQWGLHVNLDKDNKPILGAEKLPLIHKAVLDACDAIDGLKDGILQDPRKCAWDPAQIQCKGADGKNCLTKAEVEVVRKIYDGPIDAKGAPLFWGMTRGSEDQWAPTWINSGGQLGLAAGGPGFVVDNMLSYVAFFWPVGPSYRSLDFDYERDPQRLGLKEAIFNAQNPDLRKLKAAGAKLILYSGWNDNNIPPGEAVDYYDTATRTMGGPQATSDFFRMFLLPAANHCRGGLGGNDVDWISALENWVEKGQAPEQVLVHHRRDDYVPPVSPASDTDGPRAFFVRYPLDLAIYDRARPVYAYPDVARWSGQGDPNKPAGWVREAR